MSKDFRSKRRRGPRNRSEDVGITTASQVVDSPAPSLVTTPTRGGDVDYRLTQIGPVDPAVVSIAGETYRNNVMYPTTLDRVESVVRYMDLSLRGWMGRGGAVPVAGSYLKNIDSNFWPDLYVMLHEMAQMRDGYKSQDATLTTALNALYRDEMIMKIKINIRVLWAWFHCTMYNEAAKDTITAFAGKRSRIEYLLRWSDKLVYPGELDPIIKYWAQVYMPFAGGPVVAHLFNLEDILTTILPASGTATDWAHTPCLGTSQDVSDLLDDVELALTVVDKYNINVATTKTDFKLLTSLYKMMSFPVPKTGAVGAQIDHDRWVRDIYHGGFFVYDTKGDLGTDTLVFWPDIGGQVEALVHMHDAGITHDHEIENIGFHGPYAFDCQNTSTPGYTAATDDLLSMGGVSPCSFGSGPIRQSAVLYTQEDGWFDIPYAFDFTDAAGLQAWLWKCPYLIEHPDSWRAIMSEETEEDYRSRIKEGPNAFQMPWDHIGRRYYDFLQGAYKTPFG